MALPDRDPPAAKPLDAERARLRTEGFTDDEISRILVARALGASQPQAGVPVGPPGQMPMSGVLNNLSAMLAHVRGVIPAIARQIATVRDGSAPASTRAKASFLLVLAAGLIFVIGYAVFQEWQQHIISATQTAQSQAVIQAATADYIARTRKAEAAKVEADTCNSRMELLKQNIYVDDFVDQGGNFVVKPGTKSAQMIAQYNKDCDPVSGGGNRSDAAFDKAVETYQSMKKLGMDTLKSKDPNDPLPAMNAACLLGVRLSSGLKMGGNQSDSAVGDSYPICMMATVLYMPLAVANADLGPPRQLTKAPDFATRKQWLSMDLAADIKQCTSKRPDYTDLLACSCIAGAKLGLQAIADTVSFSKTLPTSGETGCNNVAFKWAESDGPGADAAYRRALSDLKNPREGKPSDPAGAFKWQKQRAQDIEQAEIKEKGKPGTRTASEQAVLGWDALFVREFSQSLAASDRSIQLDPRNLVPQTNRLHALMFLGRTTEASALYLAYRGQKFADGRIWEKVISDDFAELRKAGITHPMMADIEPAPIKPQASAKEPDPPPQSPAYKNGADARTKWESWTASLSGDAHDGAEFWARVRSDKARQHTCNEEKGTSSEAFRKACNAAKAWFVDVDKARLSNSEYRDGWNRR